jgi:methionyl-tRNA formyltransferase
LRLGFAGTPPFAVAALDALLRSRHHVAVVLTQPDRPAGRGQALARSAVKQRSLDAGLVVHQPPNLRTADALDLLRGFDLDALVVVAYGCILPAQALALPRLGCFNIHASLLPRWRGAAPIQRAVQAGDAQTGVTIMRMDPGLDTGPILTTRAVGIGPRDTSGMVHDRLAEVGGELMVESLDALAAGTAVEQLQPADGATYADKIQKSEALIDWREPAVSIDRQVRAFNPWPIAETRLNGAQLRIFEAEILRAATPGGVAAAGAAAIAGVGGLAAPGRVLAANDAGIDVACGEGVLRILAVQLAGRKRLPAGEFIRGQRSAGQRLVGASLAAA